MNPHFIFNCSTPSIVLFCEMIRKQLVAISQIFQTDANGAGKFKTGSYSVGRRSKMPELYIQMEQFRCKNSFIYYIKYHDGVNTEEAMIPPLLLQPFVGECHLAWRKS
jgi:hypothetical protein